MRIFLSTLNIKREIMEINDNINKCDHTMSK